MQFVFCVVSLYFVLSAYMLAVTAEACKKGYYKEAYIVNVYSSKERERDVLGNHAYPLSAVMPYWHCLVSCTLTALSGSYLHPVQHPLEF